MFYARIENAAEFTKILEVIKDIVPSVSLQVSDSGISIDANETFYVVQVKLKIPTSYFSEFKCIGTHTLSVHLPDFYTFLKLGSAEDSLTLQYAEGLTVLNISLEAAKVPTICSFTLNLINLKLEEIIYAEISNCGKFEINSKFLHQIFNDLSQVSEFLGINLNKLRVRFKVNSTEAGGSINLKQLKGENGTHINTPKTMNSEINLMYAKRITKAFALAERVQVKIYDGEPVIFCYSFSGIELKFCLAPAISDS